VKNRFCLEVRPVAQLAERRSPKPKVGGSMPSWPAIVCGNVVGKKLVIMTRDIKFLGIRRL
jgi:hypothetical protein